MMSQEESATPPPSPDQIVSIPLEKIQLDPKNPRKFVTQDMVEAMKNSLKALGQLSPVKVRPDGNGGFILIGGEIRYRAAKELGWTELKAIVMNVGEKEAAVLAVV